MILDELDHLGSYAALNAGFETVRAFVAATDLAALPLGRCEIDGGRVFAIVARGENQGRDGAKLEIHRKYIDVQVILSGIDEMGYKPLSECSSPAGQYDADKDLQFFSDASEAWIAVSAGRFAIFFPQDAHAPQAGEGGKRVHKVVFKVAAD